MRSSYGDTLYYGLSMFAEFEKLPYPYTPRKVSKYGPEITPYLDTFHAVLCNLNFKQILQAFPLPSLKFIK